MRNGFAVATVCTALIAAAPAAQARTPRPYDYPTQDRVEYVLECIQSKPDKPSQEMLYKCSCAIDVMRKRLPFNKFVDLLTAEKSRSIAGDRSMRDSDHVQKEAIKFRELQAKAFKECYIE